MPRRGARVPQSQSTVRATAQAPPQLPTVRFSVPRAGLAKKKVRLCTRSRVLSPATAAHIHGSHAFPPPPHPHHPLYPISCFCREKVVFAGTSYGVCLLRADLIACASLDEVLNQPRMKTAFERLDHNTLSVGADMM